MTRRRPGQRASQRRRVSIAGVVVLAIVVTAILILVNSGNDDDPALDDALSAVPSGIPQQGKTLGNAAAPVTIEDYSDFLCPHCRDFALTTERTILARYVQQGQVRIVYKHAPVFGQPAVDAAAASECAASENRFWEYHDLLFANQPGKDEFKRTTLLDLAERAGMNRSRFSACMDGDGPRQAVAQDAQDAANRGVRVTPTLFVNGVKIEGNDTQAVIAAIERALGR